MVRTDTPLPALSRRETRLPRLCRPLRIKPDNAGACSLGQDIAGTRQRLPLGPPACHRPVSGADSQPEARQKRELRPMLETQTRLHKPFRRQMPRGNCMAFPVRTALRSDFKSRPFGSASRSAALSDQTGPLVAIPARLDSKKARHRGRRALSCRERRLLRRRAPRPGRPSRPGPSSRRSRRAGCRCPWRRRASPWRPHRRRP